MTNADRRTFSESYFKRLWWKGYKGLFCSFAWPTYNEDDEILGFIPAHYNMSEYVAWKYGPALKGYVNSIAKPSKQVAAHSMGNIVMASALKSGLTVDSYVAMEAAIPSGCYDADPTKNNYGPFVVANQTQPTPDLAHPDLGYRGLMSAIRGNFHNFYSANDFALKTWETFIGIGPIGFDKATNWETGQIDYKPNAMFGYLHDATANSVAKNRIWRAFQDIPQSRDVTDHHEVMAFIARPLSEALGVVNTTLETTGFEPFDLTAPSRYPFGRDRTEHSGQYQRPIQKTHRFFNTLLQRMKIKFNFLTDVQVGDAVP